VISRRVSWLAQKFQQRVDVRLDRYEFHVKLALSQLSSSNLAMFYGDSFDILKWSIQQLAH
jgi:hypothetical protein